LAVSGISLHAPEKEEIHIYFHLNNTDTELTEKA
jgi:hypothetical protein